MSTDKKKSSETHEWIGKVAKGMTPRKPDVITLSTEPKPKPTRDKR